MATKIVENVQAALVIIGALVAYVFVPHEILGTVVLVLFILAVEGVFAVRTYLRRLHEFVKLVESNRASYRPSILAALLTDIERQLLRLGEPQDAGDAISVIRKRQALLTKAGVSLGILGITAFIIAIMVYVD